MQGAALRQRGLGARRSSSPAAPPSPSTWWRRPTAGGTSAPGDEVLITGLEHHSNIVPWQILCEEKGARLRVAALADDGSVPLDEFESLLSPAHEAGGGGARLQRAGHDQPGAPDDRAGPRARRARADRRRAGGAAPAHRRAGAGLPTSTPSPRTRCTGPPAWACSYGKRDAARGDAALAGRRRHDPLRHLREDDLQRAALQVRGGHAQHRGRDRPGRGGGLPDRRSASTQRGRARARPARLRDRRGCARCPGCGWWARRRTRRRCCRS